LRPKVSSVPLKFIVLADAYHAYDLLWRVSLQSISPNGESSGEERRLVERFTMSAAGAPCAIKRGTRLGRKAKPASGSKPVKASGRSPSLPGFTMQQSRG